MVKNKSLKSPKNAPQSMTVIRTLPVEHVEKVIHFLAYLTSQGELIVYPTSRLPSIGVCPLSLHHFQKSFSLKPLQSQILCGASLGRGNQSLYKWSRSHDQDGCHAKPFKNLLRNRKSYDLEIWHALQSLCKW